MPGTPGDGTSSKTASKLAQFARETFSAQLGAIPFAYLPSDIDTAPILVAFNRSITGLVAALEKTSGELNELRSLGKRKAFSESDPVCGRCVALAAAAGHDVVRRLAHAGDTCSKCGALVVARLPGETDAEFRVRLRAPGQVDEHGLTDAQRDGRACVICGRSGGTMIPAGRVSGGSQVFSHVECSRTARG